VNDSDVSLCVLSLPELLSPPHISPCLNAIDGVRHLLGPETILLCNKLDLLGENIDEQAIQNKIMAATGCKACWLVSLAAKRGVQSFVEGLALMLHNR